MLEGCPWWRAATTCQLHNQNLHSALLLAKHLCSMFWFHPDHSSVWQASPHLDLELRENEGGASSLIEGKSGTWGHKRQEKHQTWSASRRYHPHLSMGCFLLLEYSPQPPHPSFTAFTTYLKYKWPIHSEKDSQPQHYKSKHTNSTRDTFCLLNWQTEALLCRFLYTPLGRAGFDGICLEDNFTMCISIFNEHLLS